MGLAGGWQGRDDLLEVRRHNLPPDGESADVRRLRFMIVDGVGVAAWQRLTTLYRVRAGYAGARVPPENGDSWIVEEARRWWLVPLVG